MTGGGYYSNGTTGNLVWSTWVRYNGTAATANATVDTWDSWNTTTADATTNTLTVWAQWIDGRMIVSSREYETPEETAEQRTAREARERQRRKELAESEAKRLKAQKNALKLFVGLVGRKAYSAFKKRGYHEVIGHSGKRYRLRLGDRIQEMSENFGDKVAAWLCIHSDYTYGLPPMDTLVQQMLLILSGEQGESLLTRTANRTVAAA